jgi:hypothetical protein
LRLQFADKYGASLSPISIWLSLLLSAQLLALSLNLWTRTSFSSLRRKYQWSISSKKNQWWSR